MAAYTEEELNFRKARREFEEYCFNLAEKCNLSIEELNYIAAKFAADGM